MKRHWILGVLWLMGCGAGSPTDDGSDSTLESPLRADDDISSDDLADSELASEFIPSSASDDGAADDPAEGHEAAADNDDAPEASSEADEAPEAAPVIVIGGGGQPWEPPGDGVVVWCHASVPLGCPAIEPAPNGGRLIVVTRSAETGAFEHEAPGERAIGGGASAPAPGTPPASGTHAASGVAAPASGPPRAPLPVDVGGSVPPLPGTCVAIAFAGAGGGAGESASDAAPAAGERVAGTAPLPPPGEPGAHAPLPPLPGLPALPPSGGCISVAFPAPPAPLPGTPPNAGAGPIGVPSPPAGGCVGVAFAAASGDGDAAGASQTAPVHAGARAAHAPGMPFLCAANPPLPGRPGMPSPSAPRPGAPLPPPAGGGGHIEVHHTSDGAPTTDEAGTDEVR